MPLEKVSQCPLCKSPSSAFYLACIDYTTTKQKFNIVRCTQCNFLFTNPRPDTRSIGSYYESENYISHTGGSSGLFDSLYLIARTFMLRRKTNMIRKYNSLGKILDYGCGTGEFLEACAKKGWISSGIEPSDRASARAQINKNTAIYKSITDLPQGQFDVITLWHVLEHISELPEIVLNLKSRLKDNGTLFVAVPNYQSMDAQHYKEHWAGYDVPRHLWHFSKDTMETLMNSAGFTIKAIAPMSFDSYYVSLLSEKYKRGKHTLQGICNALINGLKSNLKARADVNHSSLIYIIKK